MRMHNPPHPGEVLRDYEDLVSMAALCRLIGETDGDMQTIRARMEVARQRRA